MFDTIDIIRTYFPNLCETQYRQFEHYERLLQETNTTVNLISRQDTGYIFTRHILHSLSIAHYHKFQEQEMVLDLGTGGGLPGIPLAILFPNTQFILVDSIGKKIGALRHMLQNMTIKNVTVCRARAEELSLTVDTVVTRAVAGLDKIVTWTSKLLKSKKSNNSKIIALKGGDLETELQGFDSSFIEVHNISEIFVEPFFSTKKVVFYYIKQK